MAQSSSSGGGYVSSMKEKFVDYGETTKRNLRIIMKNDVNSTFTFRGSSLKKIRITNNITTIPRNVFADCKNITSVGPVGSGADVEIPNSVTSIGESAFNGCTGLTSVTIPESVTNIEYSAFSNCTSLEEVNILGNPQISSNSFEGSTDNLPSEGNIVYLGKIAYCLSDKTSTQTTYTIKDGTTTLNDNLFADNTSVTTVTTPNSLISIKSNCFKNCTNLTDVTLNNGLTEIGYSAFIGCTSLVTLTLPDTLTILDNSAFVNCSSLTSMIIPDSVTGSLTATFQKCKNLTSLTVGDGITELNSLFETSDSPSGYSLDNLVLGKNIKSIYNLWGWKGRSYNKTVTNVTVNGNHGWYDGYVRPTYLKIGKDFPNKIPVVNALNPIKQYSYLSVDSQNPYYIAYDNCLIATDTNTLVFVKPNSSHSLSSQNTITTIGQGYNIFSNSNKYSYSFSLPESVTTIKSSAFNDAYFYHLTIPASVTKIESSALYNAVNAVYNNQYSGLHFESLVPPTLDNNALDCSSDNKFKITVPAAAYSTYKNAWSQHATRIVPDNYSQLQEKWIDLYECCVNGELHMKQKRQLSNDGITWYDSYIYADKNWEIETRHNEEVLGECSPNLSISIPNDGFVTSTEYGTLADTASDYDFYESTLPYNKQGRNTIEITLYGYQTFTFKIKQNVYYDYYEHLYVQNLDDLSVRGTCYGKPSTGSGIASNDYVKQNASTGWTDVTFSNLDGGEHKIKIRYESNNYSSASSSTNKGYVAIPKVQ